MSNKLIELLQYFRDTFQEGENCRHCITLDPDSGNIELCLNGPMNNRDKVLLTDNDLDMSAKKLYNNASHIVRQGRIKNNR